ncbi:MAG: hypothetical protein KDB90_09575 [Planctomycetes bacterium]|nr:hypothetical protein [Planctomycetota bacterium]
MRYAICLLLAICTAQLSAQTAPPIPPGTPTPDPSAAKESFVTQPAAVDRGARGLAMRLVANDPAGFANSSSKQPVVRFSAGVTLVPGSFQLLNQNEAQFSIDVDQDADGTIEVSLDLYSVNGTKVLKTLRGTLGIKGTTAVSGSQAKVGVESVLLVRVNSPDPQPAGVIVITGAIAGSVSIKAPTGCAFDSEPTVTTTSGTINSPALAQANTIFSFAIGNAALDTVTVRVDGIKYNTQYFGLVGGIQGDLACEVSGAALSNQTALVVNAFTAKSAIQGSNDNGDPAPAPAETPSGSESSASTSGSSPSPSSINTGSRPLDSSSNTRGNRNRNGNTGNTGGGGSFVRPSTNSSGPSRGSGFAPLPNNSRGLPNQSPSGGPSGGGGAIGKGTGGDLAGSGSITQDTVPKDDLDQKLEKKIEPKVLEVSPGLHFCDKDFKPVTALVLDKAVSDEAGGRVWIVLKLKKDKNPEKIETVTVKLTVNGTSRELALTETGKNTGEFRCGKDGILVVANENPDSNAEEKAAEPPKPRNPR